MNQERENFGSRIAVIFAMAGSAIGLGNIWRFPYVAGEHGGAAFVLVYILCTMIVSLPVFIAEVLVGRRSRRTAYGAMTGLRPGRRIWKVAACLSIAIPAIIASYYSVIGGWSISYLVKACTGVFVREDPSAMEGVFSAFISNPWLPMLAHLVFLALCAVIVCKGVKSGIEKFSKISIPVLFVLILGMLVYSITLPGSGEGVKYLLKPDFSQIDARSFAYAMGQSFYSLSLGMGAIITYGSYISKKENLIVSSAWTAVSDLMFAILAGLAIMPAVFAAGIEPGAGPGLVFQSIPYIFSSLGTQFPVLSTVVSISFFLAVTVAALTSNISLFEVGVSFLEERYKVRRSRGCIFLFIFCGAVGAICSLSFGPLSGLTLNGMNIFDMLDGFSSNILLLILAFLVVIFVGFALRKDEVIDELTNGGTVLKKKPALVGTVYFLIKWVAPVFIALIFITNFIL